MDKLIQERSKEPNQCTVHSSFYNGERGPVRFYRLVSNNLQIKKGRALDLRLENFLNDFLRDDKDLRSISEPPRRKSDFRMQGIDKSVLMAPSGMPTQSKPSISQPKRMQTLIDPRKNSVYPQLPPVLALNNGFVDRNQNSNGIAYPRPVAINAYPQPMPIYYPPAHTDKRISMMSLAPPPPTQPPTGLHPMNHSVVNAYVSRY